MASSSSSLTRGPSKLPNHFQAICDENSPIVLSAYWTCLHAKMLPTVLPGYLLVGREWFKYSIRNLVGLIYNWSRPKVHPTLDTNQLRRYFLQLSFWSKQLRLIGKTVFLPDTRVMVFCETRRRRQVLQTIRGVQQFSECLCQREVGDFLYLCIISSFEAWQCGRERTGSLAADVKLWVLTWYIV